MVAAEDERLAPWEYGVADPQLGLGEQVRHRVRGVESVPGVGHEVEPQVLAEAVVVDPLRERVLQFALVQVRAELLGQRDPGAASRTGPNQRTGPRRR